MLKTFLTLTVTIFSISLVGCTKDAKPKYKNLDCLFMKANSDVESTYFKIVGIADGKYTVKTCLERQLRSNGQSPEPTQVRTPEQCFGGNIDQFAFNEFESRKDGRGNDIPLLPIDCSEVK